MYTYQGKNIVGIGSFKSYFGLWYYQGALLKDEKKILINAQEGKTKALRQIRFEGSKDIDADLIRSYTLEAIQNQKEGREIKAERNKAFSIALELKNILAKNEELSQSFTSLTYGKQKEYSEFIENAKRENTRIKRLEKCIPMILKGVGLNDSYKK